VGTTGNAAETNGTLLDAKDVKVEAGGAEQGVETSTGALKAEVKAEKSVSVKEEPEEMYERDASELLTAFGEKEEAEEKPVDMDALMKQFMLEMKDVDRDNEVNRVLWAFKLNPLEKLNLRFTATAGEVKRAYRQVIQITSRCCVCCKHDPMSMVLNMRLTYNERLERY
jgi:hypothetical protein